MAEDQSTGGATTGGALGSLDDCIYFQATYLTMSAKLSAERVSHAVPFTFHRLSLPLGVLSEHDDARELLALWLMTR